MGRTGLEDVKDRISAAAADAGRSDVPTLVVVAKYASDLALEAVIAEGANHIGESRADALAERAARFRDISWHFVGRLQGNKVRSVRAVVHLLHAMDRPGLAEYWARESPGAAPVLVQVNLAGEESKAGVAPSDVQALVDKCVGLGLEVRGLMTVPPRPKVPADSGRWFTQLRELRDRVALDHPGVRELSMGMTDDFGSAVAEGSTILRVGRAIFDPFQHEG